MINVLFVDSGSGHGGSASYLYSFLKFIDRSRFSPYVLLYNYSEAPRINEIKNLGIEVIFLTNQSKKEEKAKGYDPDNKLLKVIRLLKFLLKLVSTHLPESIKIRKIILNKQIKIILMGSDVDYNISAVLASIMTGKICIVRKSGGVVKTKVNIIQRILSRFVDMFIASSKSEADYHKTNKLYFKDMSVIYEGIDINSFFPYEDNMKIRNEFDLPAESKLICSISRFDIGKGHFDILRAADLVKKKYPGAVFIIVGDDFDFKKGQMRKQLEDQVNRMGLTGNFIFTGWRTDILDILQGIDIFVHCPNTWREGMGIATLEAIACGKPTIVTNNSGLAETTEDNYNGFVVPIGDYSALAEKILLLLNDENKRKEMGSNSRLRAETLFNIEQNVRKTEEIFDKLLKFS